MDNNKCEKCGKELKGEEYSKNICLQCEIEQAEKLIPPEKKRDDNPTPVKTGRGLKIIKWAIIIVCVPSSVIYLMNNKSLFQDKKAIRIGSYETDEQTDKCISNLWKISKLLQEGKQTLPDGLVCPVCKEKYILKSINGEIQAFCPAADKHGLKELKVSSKKQIPEVIK